MRRALNWLIVLPFALVAILVAVANRTPVTLSVDPFTRDSTAFSITAPLFAVVILAVILGVIVGGIAVWWKQGRYRKRCRVAEQELAEARREIDTLRRDSRPAGPLAFLDRPAA